MATQTYSSGGDVHLVVAGLRGGEGEGDTGGGAGGGRSHAGAVVVCLCCAMQFVFATAAKVLEPGSRNKPEIKIFRPLDL